MGCYAVRMASHYRPRPGRRQPHDRHKRKQYYLEVGAGGAAALDGD